ncbi:cell division protein ZapA [Mesosutterella sp. OilRF-GAM-744-9]|uniref:Cell division protein ZapA n=2 Tax=Mesosutterella TaxID=2494213 RepID=A0ABS9MTE0_9BURK|nr:cell division protein ZapA [Mesosutterella sp. oilRF-744-WT-GAM-9]MCG5031657.1 cell division protein ZapA [Mesosutterella sp. oilRF-744-WT-GAM-9]
MSDLSLNIMDRTFRLAVAPENAEKLQRCGAELDRRMREIRESGRVLGYDQIAVMVALDLIWTGFDKDEEARINKSRQQEASSKIEQLRAECEAAIARNQPEQTPAESAPEAVDASLPRD